MGVNKNACLAMPITVLHSPNIRMVLFSFAASIASVASTAALRVSFGNRNTACFLFFLCNLDSPFLCFQISIATTHSCCATNKSWSWNITTKFWAFVGKFWNSNNAYRSWRRLLRSTRRNSKLWTKWSVRFRNETTSCKSIWRTVRRRKRNWPSWDRHFETCKRRRSGKIWK